MDTLAPPFNRIFPDVETAHWAFDTLRYTITQLGLHNPYDVRFALTLVNYSSTPALHLSFGGWLVLGFRAGQIELTLLAELVHSNYTLPPLESTVKEGNPEVRSYTLPLDKVRPMTSDLQHAFQVTLTFVADKFSDWKRSPYWKQHRPELVEAVFKPETRPHLLATGLADLDLLYEPQRTAFYHDISEDRAAYTVNPSDDTGEIMTEETPTDTDLAPPLSKIFTNRAEAEWVFDLLEYAFDELGITSPDDERYVISQPKGRNNLHFTLGNWLTLAFNNNRKSNFKLTLALFQQSNFSEHFHIERESGDGFKQPDHEPAIGLYRLKIDEIVMSKKAELKAFWQPTLVFIAKKFRNWKRSIYRKSNHPIIAQAIFDPDVRAKLFNGELSLDTNIEAPDDTTSTAPKYSLEELAADTSYDPSEVERWVRAIKRKGQAILYGPPGTGKTFLAEHLARYLIGGGDGFREVVQFHPAYAYEDFMQGLRPVPREGRLDYQLVPGRFLEFCAKAEQCNDPCVLIIDEINRTNLSRVFGELMYLLEYRTESIPLAGGGERFQIPAKVVLLGTMNTADRSIALVDHALRRRFAFIKLSPNFEILYRYHKTHTDFPPGTLAKLIQQLERLNQAIGDPDYAIGITFFMDDRLQDHLGDIWQMEIEPYLDEYFFDRPAHVDEFRWERIKDTLSL